jgi:Phosphotransferase enzyme family
MEHRLARSAPLAAQTPNETLLRALVQQMPFKEYAKTAHTICANHAFWHPLLPADLRHDRIALVLETRLGALTACLAARFGKIISWHRDPEAARQTGNIIAERGVRNVQIHVAADVAQLHLAPASLAAIIVVGLDHDATAQWSNVSQALMQNFPSLAMTYLEADGTLVMHDNNAWAYRHDAGDLHHVSPREPLPLVRRRLKHAFTSTEVLVSRASLTAEHVPCPDYVPSDARLIDVHVPKNRYARVKSTILNLRPSRQLWPSYLMLGSNAARPSLVEDILQKHRSAPGLQWLTHADPEVKRVIAGNAGTSIVICGPRNGDPANDVVLRLPSTPRGEALCQTNALALKTIQSGAFAGKAPLLLADGELSGATFWIESRAGGRELQYGSDNLQGPLVSACASLLAFHQADTSYAAIDRERFDELIAPCFDDLMSAVGPQLQDRLGLIQAKLRNMIIGMHASIGATHGDFKLGNMLFTPSNTLQSLIDWDGYRSAGFQVFDYLTHLLYTLASESEATLVHLYLDHILPWKIPGHLAVAVDGPIAALAPDRASFQALRIVFWFSQIATRFDRLYKLHSEGQAIYLTPALATIEKMLGIARMEPVTEAAA